MNLQVTIPTANGGFVMKNPIMPAAATFGNVIEYMDVFDISILGAVMPNSLGMENGAPNRIRRVYKGETTFTSAFGPNNISVKSFVKEILPRLPWDKVPVVLDIKARSMDEMEDMAAYLSGVNEVAGIELNLNCPYYIMDVEPYWQNPGTLAELVGRAKKAAGAKPVFIKAPSADIPQQQVSQTLHAAGADAFVSYNGIEGCAVDIYTRKYCCGGMGRSSNMGYGLKQYALRCTQLAALASPMPVIGSGGIINAKNIIEHVLVGAHAVQVGSANLMRPDFMKRLLEELDALMDELGIESLDEIRGTATAN